MGEVTGLVYLSRALGPPKHLTGAPVSETPADEGTERAAVVDLLGVLAYGQLIAFERLADDARLAPTLLDKAALGGMAVAEYQHFELIERHLRKIGVDPVLAMAPFVAPLDDFHDLTAPSDWLEGLVKAFVGDGIGTDFYREVSTFLDDETQALVVEVLSDERHAQFAIDRVRAAIEADPARGRPARAVGPAAGGRGAGAGAAGGRRPRGADPADRRRRGGRGRPGRARPDAGPAHRGAHQADGPARPPRLGSDAPQPPKPTLRASGSPSST